MKPGRKRRSIAARPSVIDIAYNRRLFRRCALAILLLCACTRADAQTDNRIAVGARVSLREPADPAVRGHDGIGLLARFGHGDTGWGWAWGLNWVSAEINQPVGDSVVPLGKMHLRPVMAGYGYHYRRGRQVYYASLVGGYAFVSMALAPEAVDAYHDRLGARSVSLETSNTLALRPEIGVWHDLAAKVGLNVSASFLMARPEVTVRTSTGSDERHIRADMFQIKVGVVYSIF